MSLQNMFIIYGDMANAFEWFKMYVLHTEVS